MNCLLYQSGIILRYPPLRIRTCENDDVTSLLKGGDNTSSLRSLNVSLTDDDVLGGSTTDSDGTPSLETDTLILQIPFRESGNLESIFDVHGKGLNEFMKGDDDAANKSETVKSGVFLDGIPEHDEVRCNWLVFDTDDEGRLDEGGDDPEVDGSGKDDFGWRGRVETERFDDTDVIDDCESTFGFEDLITSGVMIDEGVFRTDDLEDCTRIHFEE